MKSISSQLQAALDSVERYGCIFITFTFGSTVYGLWSGAGNREYNGVPYGPGAALLEVSEVQEAADGSTSEFTMTLNENPDIGLDVDILSTFYEEDWHMQSVVIQLGMRDPATDDIIDTQILFDGLLYQAPLVKGESGYAIKARCVSQATHMAESGSKYRNKSIQYLLDPTDTALADIGGFVGDIEKSFKWGQS